MRLQTNIIYTLIILVTVTDLQHPRADRKTCTGTDCETKKRNTDHIDDILLRPDPLGYDDTDPSTKAVLKELRTVYQNMIKPVEEQFRYPDLKRHRMSDVDIYAKPIILLVGPWSTGKSTMINYLLGIEGALESLYVGAEPTTADFTVVSYGDEYRTVEGVVLATDSTKPFASMEKFGQIFLEHLLGVELNSPLLRNVTFIDTPGILENRRQQERGYPYNDVMRWLVHRSDLIFVVFDPTKLDVGYELETLFNQLKGKESVLRIILNKADSIPEQELMRVYGALFWSLSPLINVTEPPRVYVGSFWGEPYHEDEDLSEVLLREEKSLLHDMREVIRNRVYNKIAFVRQYAIRVRIHALMVDSYVTAYRRNKGFFGNGEELAEKIVENPQDYDVFKTVVSYPNVSKYDLPDPQEYEDFFRINPLTEQRRISEHCGYFSGCKMELLNQAIGIELPNLLRRFQSPNEGRRHQKRHQFEPILDFRTWKEQAAAERKAGVQKTGGETSGETDQAQPAVKKYRKSVQLTQPEPIEQKVPEPALFREDDSGRGKKVKRPVKKLGKSSQESVGETRDKPKRRRRSKDEPEKPSQPVSKQPAPPKVEPPIKNEEKKEMEDIPSPPKARPKLTPSAKKVGKPAAVPSKSAASQPGKKEKQKKVSVSIEKQSRTVEKQKQEQAPPKVVENVPHKGSTVPESSSDATKCNKYRKSCQEGSPEVGTTENSLPKKPAPPPPAKPSQPSVQPSVGVGPKCNKYRKSCQEGYQPESVGIPKAKPASPVPAPAPVTQAGVKCNKYRKSCQGQVATEGTSGGKKEEPKKPQMKKDSPPPPPAPVVPSTVSGKCNKYRKSCQSGEQAVPMPEQKDQGKTKETYDYDPSPSPITKCTKYSYRISCRGTRDDDDDNDNEKKPAPPKKEIQRTNPAPAPSAPQVPASGPCNKYRKSCQQNPSGEVPVVKVEKKVQPSVKQEVKVELKKPQANPAVKCNKYRKSCQTGSESSSSSAGISPPKQESIKNPPKLSNPHSPPIITANSDGSIKCNKYRKSCQAALGLPQTEKPKPKPAPAASPSGNAKKPCKKKNPSSPSSSGAKANPDTRT